MSFDMQYVAKATGLTASVIRVWEARYGWPRPLRHKNGYRAFSQHEVDQLKRVAALVKAGAHIASLIVDGSPHIPGDHPVQQRPVALAHAIAAPDTERGREARAAVEDAIDRLDLAALRKQVLAAVLVHPRDRDRAVYAPVIAFLAEAFHLKTALHESGRAKLVEALSTALGHDVLVGIEAGLQEASS